VCESSQTNQNALWNRSSIYTHGVHHGNGTPKVTRLLSLFHQQREKLNYTTLHRLSRSISWHRGNDGARFGMPGSAEVKSRRRSHGLLIPSCHVGLTENDGKVAPRFVSWMYVAAAEGGTRRTVAAVSCAWLAIGREVMTGGSSYQHYSVSNDSEASFIHS
jgi:hypothetical protein